MIQLTLFDMDSFLSRCPCCGSDILMCTTNVEEGYKKITCYKCGELIRTEALYVSDKYTPINR